LLHDIIPHVTGDWSPTNVRTAITSVETSRSAGFMGEGFFIPEELGANGYSALVARQRQDNQFCTIWPAAISTCSNPLQLMPTWRERVTLAEYAAC
jgi:hypothetical protein